MMRYGRDDLGNYRLLDDGRVLRVQQRMYNTLLTLSQSAEALTWEHGW